MGSFLGIVIFNSKPTDKVLDNYWWKWAFIGTEEVERDEKSLPFDSGRFQEKSILKVCDINSENLENIGFVITPALEFFYYYDYDTNDATDYYRRQLYLKPSFEETLKKVLAEYQDAFFVHATCRC